MHCVKDAGVTEDDGQTRCQESGEEERFLRPIRVDDGARAQRRIQSKFT